MVTSGALVGGTITPNTTPNIPTYSPYSATGVVPTDLTSVRVYPNPWRSDQHRGIPITFGSLTQSTTVSIFSVSGRLVRTLPTCDLSTTWDLTNDSGETVSSGLYIYLITNAQGQKTHGTMAVIQ
jgi:hypothetical protein